MFETSAQHIALKELETFFAVVAWKIIYCYIFLFL